MKETLLLIEDDMTLRKAIQMVLAKKYNVQECANGAEALSWLEKNPAPSVILLDLVMPCMDGFELMRQFSAKKTKDVPIVVMTSSDNIEHRKLCGKLGARDFLKKPLNLFELDLSIHKAILNSRMDEMNNIRQKYAKVLSSI